MRDGFQRGVWRGKSLRELWLPILIGTALLLFLAAAGTALILFLTAPKGPENPLPAEVPDWVEEALLPINEYSRPGTWLDGVSGVVIHYTGNPGTSARQNRDYFAGLARSGESYVSSNFIVGLEGEALVCVPVNEVAYASGERNRDTLSIEVCHPDETGEFGEETYRSLVKLVQWLVDRYGLEREDILRHYDVMGKECPRYYVRNPDAWEGFLDELVFGS